METEAEARMLMGVGPIIQMMISLQNIVAASRESAAMLAREYLPRSAEARLRRQSSGKAWKVDGTPEQPGHASKETRLNTVKHAKKACGG